MFIECCTDPSFWDPKIYFLHQSSSIKSWLPTEKAWRLLTRISIIQDVPTFSDPPAEEIDPRSLWIPSSNPRHKNSVILRGFSSPSSGLAFLFLILSPWNDGWGQRRRGVGLLEIVLLESDRSVISVTITGDGWPGVMLPVLQCTIVYCAHYTDIHQPDHPHCPTCHNTNVESHQSRTQTRLSKSTSLNIVFRWVALKKCPCPAYFHQVLVWEGIRLLCTGEIRD